MSNLREEQIDSDMTRQLYGTKVDFLELVKPLGKISLVSCVYGSWQPYQVSKEGHFLKSPGTSGYLGDFDKRGIYLNL